MNEPFFRGHFNGFLGELMFPLLCQVKCSYLEFKKMLRITNETSEEFTRALGFLQYTGIQGARH